MRMLLASGFALVAMSPVALAEAPTATSSRSDAPIRLTESQMDQVKAGNQNCEGCMQIVVDGKVVYLGPVRPCPLGLVLCNNNNQQTQDGTNIAGDFTTGGVSIEELTINLPASSD